MWQELRHYWLPLMLFMATVLIALVLLVMVVVAPYLVGHLRGPHRLLALFAEDATVRRTTLVGVAGLIVTAFVFFRPDASFLAKKHSSRKSPHDTIAGA